MDRRSFLASAVGLTASAVLPNIGDKLIGGPVLFFSVGPIPPFPWHLVRKNVLAPLPEMEGTPIKWTLPYVHACRCGFVASGMRCVCLTAERRSDGSMPYGCQTEEEAESLIKVIMSEMWEEANTDSLLRHSRCSLRSS